MEFLTNLFKPKYEIVDSNINTSINEKMEKTNQLTVDEIVDLFVYKSKNIDEILNTTDDESKLDVLRKQRLNNPLCLKRLILSIKNYPNDMILLCTSNKVNVKDIELIQHKINVNYADNNGRTCLWVDNCSNDVDYLIDLINSNIKFNINHQNHLHNTFFATLISSYIKTQQLLSLMKILIAKDYQFNLHSSYSLLDHAIATNKPVEIILQLIKCKHIDITTSTFWLYQMIKNYTVINIEHVVNKIIQREDYKLFLNHVINKYGLLYGTADQDLLYIMTLFLYEKQDQLMDMVLYVNEDGNNLLHLACQYHLDKVIRFLMTRNNDRQLLLIKNKQGKTPYDLYYENDISKLLYHDIKLF